MKKYIYHYHAMSQSSDGNIQHMDGILSCNVDITTQEAYRDAKKVISDVPNLVISSLSLLRTEGVE